MKKFHYFIRYTLYSAHENVTSHGMASVSTELPITSIEQLTELSNDIASQRGLHPDTECVIDFYTILRIDDEC